MTAAPSPAGWAQLFTLLEQLDGSAYEDVAIELEGLSLHLSKHALPSTQPHTQPESAPVTKTAPESPASPAPAAAPTAEPAAEPAAGNLVPVTAPMLGVIYRRPAPDQAPFVQVGDVVSEDTTVAIVEVMKLMNPVSAGTSGRVAAIHVEDGDLVEFGQVLLAIEPVDAP